MVPRDLLRNVLPTAGCSRFYDCICVVLHCTRWNPCLLGLLFFIWHTLTVGALRHVTLHFMRHLRFTCVSGVNLIANDTYARDCPWEMNLDFTVEPLTPPQVIRREIDASKPITKTSLRYTNNQISNVVSPVFLDHWILPCFVRIQRLFHKKNAP